MLSGARLARGFTLVELMVAVSVLILLTALALPNFTTWIRNAQVRTVAETFQTSVRLAQGEAQRRNQSVVLFRTNDKECRPAATAVANGANWQIRSVPNPLMTDDIPQAVQCGVLTDASSNVTVTSPTDTVAICFAADGRQTTLAAPAAIGVGCTAGAARYRVAPDGNHADNRPLQLDVSLSGSVRMCDPNRSNTPDGCR